MKTQCGYEDGSVECFVVIDADAREGCATACPAGATERSW